MDYMYEELHVQYPLTIEVGLLSELLAGHVVTWHSPACRASHRQEHSGTPQMKLSPGSMHYGCRHMAGNLRAVGFNGYNVSSFYSFAGVWARWAWEDCNGRPPSQTVEASVQHACRGNRSLQLHLLV